MFKRKARRATAALLALSLVSAGVTFQVPFVNDNAIVAEAAIDPNTYARDYGYYTNTSNMKGRGIAKDWLFAFNNSKPDEVYLESYGASGNTITIPSKLGKQTVKGVSRDITVYGNVTNIEIDYTQMANDSYFNLVRAVLPKITNLKQINGETLIFDNGNINTNASNNAKYFLSRLNSEDNSAISNAMVKYIKALAKDEINRNTPSTPYDKARILHDWILKDHDYRASGAYVKGDWCVFMNPDRQANCDGCTRGYYLLLKYSGIEAYYEGYGGHAANIIKIYDKYYHVDVSHDLQGSDHYNNTPYHEHFLKSDEIWYTKHTENTGGLKEDEKAIKNGNYRYVIRRPSKLYDTGIYEDYKWNNLTYYGRDILCNTTFGDVNNDKLFDSNDITVLKQVLTKQLKYESLSTNGKKAIDIYQDNCVDNWDHYCMQTFLDSVKRFNYNYNW